MWNLKASIRWIYLQKDWKERKEKLLEDNKILLLKLC